MSNIVIPYRELLKKPELLYIWKVLEESSRSGYHRWDLGENKQQGKAPISLRECRGVQWLLVTRLDITRKATDISKP